MYYVITGYCGPDHYTCKDGPLLELKVYTTSKQVEQAYQEFLSDSFGKDCDQQVFKVIKGKEVQLKPKEVVTVWEVGE